MLSDREQTDVLAKIAEASDHQLAEIVEHALIAYGRAGRPVSEALLERIKDGGNDYVAEGIGQLMTVEGVLDGRTDEL